MWALGRALLDEPSTEPWGSRKKLWENNEKRVDVRAGNPSRGVTGG